MEDRTSDTDGEAWFLAGLVGAVQEDDAVQADHGPAEPEDGTHSNVIIAVSLDELDGLTGDLLV